MLDVVHRGGGRTTCEVDTSLRVAGRARPAAIVEALAGGFPTVPLARPGAGRLSARGQSTRVASYGRPSAPRSQARAFAPSDGQW